MQSHGTQKGEFRIVSLTMIKNLCQLYLKTVVWVILWRTRSKIHKHRIVMDNKRLWENSDAFEIYSKISYLQKPEEAVLNRLKSKLEKMRMLDIGVGGGRTTCQFEKFTKEYVGVDYSTSMIRACKKRFSKIIDLVACDARFMPFRDRYFDFMLFSYNGIDYVPHEDRLKELREVQRMGTINGIFFFSTHNLCNTNKLFSFLPSRSPVKLFYHVTQFILLRLANNNIEELQKQSYALINDGSHNFKLVTYYTTPQAQIEQLIANRFENVEIFSIEGEQIKEEIKLRRIEDPWLYYLCQICLG